MTDSSEVDAGSGEGGAVTANAAVPGDDRLQRSLGALETVLAEGGDRLDPGLRARAHLVLTRATERLQLGAGHTVVALVGATGSGKSSLFNAISGLEMARVGATRPTTTSSWSCVWGYGGEQLLDWLDVPREQRVWRETVLDADHEQDLHGLVLLDLPDHDSTEQRHRDQVDRMVGLADILVFVVDPQKYADEAIHRRYLSKLADHEGSILVLLNQVDRLTPEQTEACVADLGRLLRADGLEHTTVMTTSTRSREGVSQVREALVAAVAAGTAPARRLDADARSVLAALRADLGTGERSPQDLPGDDLDVAVVRAAGIPEAIDAVTTRDLARARRATGWPVAALWGRGPAHRVPGPADPDTEGGVALAAAPVREAVRRFAETASEGLPASWTQDVTDVAERGAEDLPGALVPGLAEFGPRSRTESWWIPVRWLQWVLALAALVGLVVLVAGLLGAGPGWVLPAAVVVGSLVAGAVVAAVSRMTAGASCRERRHALGEQARAIVGRVVADRVVSPVATVLEQHRRARLAAGPGEDPQPGATPETGGADGSGAPAAPSPSDGDRTAVAGS